MSDDAYIPPSQYQQGYQAAIKDAVARIRMHAAGANAPSDMASAVVAALEWVAVCIERGEAKGAGERHGFCLYPTKRTRATALGHKRFSVHEVEESHE